MKRCNSKLIQMVLAVLLAFAIVFATVGTAAASNRNPNPPSDDEGEVLLGGQGDVTISNGNSVTFYKSGNILPGFNPVGVAPKNVVCGSKGVVCPPGFASGFIMPSGKKTAIQGMPGVSISQQKRCPYGKCGSYTVISYPRSKYSTSSHYGTGVKR